MIEHSWPSSASSVPLKFHFWQVALTSHSTEAQLIATYLSSIKMHDFGIVRGIAIYINIFSQIHLRGDLSYVEVSIGNNQRLRYIVKPSYFPVQAWRLFVYIFLAPKFLMTPLQDAICLLPGDRILAFSNDHMMIYSFVTTGEAGVASPVLTPHITEPLLKLPLRIDFGGLSQGLSNETATLFVVNAGPLYGLIIPHNEH